jgi:gluconate 2-dehydrogenase gamma chain
LASTTVFLLGGLSSRAAAVAGGLPWTPNAGSPPVPVKPGPWVFFSGPEGQAIDRQMAGPYGRNEGLYNSPPFLKGTKQQGQQSEAAPAQQYRQGLAALDRYCRSKYSNKAFAELADNDKDDLLSGLEHGKVELEGVDGAAFFEQVLTNVKEGFFGDPIHGGNRDMVAWRMIGYPGSRYNYLDWVHRHNERFPLPPVGITGRADWTPKSR